MANKRLLKLSKIELTTSGSWVSLMTTIWILVLRGTNQYFVKEHGKVYRLDDFLKSRWATGLRLVTSDKYNHRGFGGLHGCEIICFDHLFAHVIEADGRFNTTRYMDLEDRKKYDNFVSENS